MGRDAVWALNESFILAPMSPGAIFTKKPKELRHGSRIRTAASLVANILGQVGGMVPVFGPCIEGVAKAAKGLLESLEVSLIVYPDLRS